MDRCEWANGNELLRKYHDEEWGVPVHDDRKHFEFLMLESAQSGLSWLTILKRREGYRKAYDGFDPEKIAGYGPDRIERLSSTPASSGIGRKSRLPSSTRQNFWRFKRNSGASTRTSGGL